MRKPSTSRAKSKKSRPRSWLASRPLDGDSGNWPAPLWDQNGLGLMGRILGMASASRNLAAGIGFYGAAISIY